MEYPFDSGCYKYRINFDKSITVDLDSITEVCFLKAENLKFANTAGRQLVNLQRYHESLVFFDQVANFPCEQKGDDLFSQPSFNLRTCLREKRTAGQMMIELKKRFGIIPDLAPAYFWQWEASYIVFDPGKKVYLFLQRPYKVVRGPATLHTTIVRYDFYYDENPIMRVYLEKLKRNLLTMNQDYYGESWLQRSNQSRDSEKKITDHQAFIYSKGELVAKNVVREKARENMSWEYGIAGNVGYFLNTRGDEIKIVFKE
jgi:hypothetical protein